MGSLFSKEQPGVKPRDESRVKAAAENIKDIRDALVKLGESIEGSILLPDSDDDAAYHKQRERPFYFNDSNYPSAIIVVESVKDVAEVLKFVSGLDQSKYTLAIAAGAHSHYCYVEKSIVLDLENLKSVSVDKENKIMTIGGGAKIKVGVEALKGTNLMFVTGTNLDTGISGLTLAGGAGYLGGQAGFACDTVVEAQVVLANGEIVTARDDNEYADLMRALRGGGGNFGVVTQWKFKLYDVSNSFGGAVVHFAPTQARLKIVLDTLSEKVLPTIPNEGSCVLAMPCGAPVFISALTLIGDIAKDMKTYKDNKWLKESTELNAWFRVQNDVVRRDFHTEIAPMLEPNQQREFATVSGIMAYSFDEQVRDALIHFTRVDYPPKPSKAIILVMFFNGKMNTNDASKSSIRHRKGRCWIIFEHAYEPWATEEEIKKGEEWRKRAKDRLIELGGEDGPHNFCDTDGRRITFFTKEQRDFLETTKQKYDPKNVFALNKNIVSHIE